MPISNALWILICAVVGYALVSLVFRQLSQPKRAATPNVETSNTQEQRYRHVLGESYDAGEREIKTAYKLLLAKYHPDKLTHLGDEFLAIAEQKTRELVEAYEFLEKKYKW